MFAEAIAVKGFMIKVSVKLKCGKLEAADAISGLSLTGVEPDVIYTARLTKQSGLNSDIDADQRSVAQNRLYYMWLTDMQNTDINEYAGNESEWWAFEMKRLFLCKIYERDSQSYAESIEAVRHIYSQGMIVESENLHQFIVNETSTKKATVKQFSEYLNYIERYCHERGMTLRTDSWLYGVAII